MTKEQLIWLRKPPLEVVFLCCNASYPKKKKKRVLLDTLHTCSRLLIKTIKFHMWKSSNLPLLARRNIILQDQMLRIYNKLCFDIE